MAQTRTTGILLEAVLSERQWKYFLEAQEYPVAEEFVKGCARGSAEVLEQLWFGKKNTILEELYENDIGVSMDGGLVLRAGAAIAKLIPDFFFFEKPLAETELKKEHAAKVADHTQWKEGVETKLTKWVKWVTLLGTMRQPLSNVKISRGLFGLPPDVIEGLMQKKPGEHIFLAAMPSTPLDAGISESSAEQTGPAYNNVIFTIENVTEGLIFQASSMHPKQKEILLPPLTMLRVKEVIKPERHPPKPGRITAEFEGCYMTDRLQRACKEDLRECTRLLGTFAQNARSPSPSLIGAYRSRSPLGAGSSNAQGGQWSRSRSPPGARGPPRSEPQPAPQTPAREVPAVPEAGGKLLSPLQQGRCAALAATPGPQPRTPLQTKPTSSSPVDLSSGALSTQAASTPSGGHTAASSPGGLSIQGKAELWTYTPANGKSIQPREVPDIHGKKVGDPLSPGDRFWVVEEKKVGSVTFLRLDGGEGWLFDHKPDVGLMCTRAHSQEVSTPSLVPKGQAVEQTVSETGRKLGPGANRTYVLVVCLVGLLLLTVGVICIDAGSWDAAIMPTAFLVVMLVGIAGVFAFIQKCKPTKEMSMVQAPLLSNQP